MSASILSRKDHGFRPAFCLNTNTVISFLEGASTPRCRPCRVPSWVRNWWGFFFAVIGAVTRLPVDRLLTRRRRPRLSPFFPRRGAAALAVVGAVALFAAVVAAAALPQGLPPPSSSPSRRCRSSPWSCPSPLGGGQKGRQTATFSAR